MKISIGPNNNKVSKLTQILSTIGIELALLALIIVSGILEPKFIRASNIVNVLRQVSITGVIAIGMTLVIINNGIDLSVCGIVGLSGMLAIILQPQGTTVALIVGLGVGIISGIINGFCISQGLAPFIMTMAMDTVLRGIAYLTSNGQPVSGVTEAYKFLGTGYVLSFTLEGRLIGVPTPVVIFVLVKMNAQKVWYMFEGNNLVKAWENAEMRIKMQICATRKTKRPKRCCIQYLTDLKSLEEAL